MPLYYVTSASTAAPTAAFDAVEIVAPASGIVLIKRLYVWQTSDLGDANEEVLRADWVRGNSTSGSGGQTTVITPNNSFDAAATFTAELLNTTPATTGGLSLCVQGWNVRQPLELIFPPGEELVLRNSERGCLRISAPADAITVNACAFVEQV